MSRIKSPKAETRQVLRPLPVYLGLSAMLGASQADLARMTAGIQAYQSHPYRRKGGTQKTIWQKGTTSIRVIKSTLKNASNSLKILLIPSMINRSYILDLLPKKSMARWLAKQGFDVFILDWGSPVEDEGQASIDGVLGERLLPAMSFLAEQEGAYAAAGYCMGGTLLAAAASLQSLGVDKYVFLASPWDFHAGDRRLQAQVLLGTQQALDLMDSQKFLPSSWIQAVFAAVNADRNAQKFQRFLEMDQDSDEAKLFVAVEDWLNDGVDLSAGLARTCIADWYAGNMPAKGLWAHQGKPIVPQNIKTPSLVITSENDRLVPRESALALANLIPGSTKMQTSCGHIGMMTGHRAEEEVWKPMAAWLAG